MTKAEIRKHSKILGLSNYNEPSNSCLATRIPAGTVISTDILAKVEKIEDLAHSVGLNNIRARLLDDKIKLEMPKNSEEIFKTYKIKLENLVKSMGFTELITGER